MQPLAKSLFDLGIHPKQPVPDNNSGLEIIRKDLLARIAPEKKFTIKPDGGLTFLNKYPRLKPKFGRWI